MKGDNRRQMILRKLGNATEAIPARVFADEFAVSRQIIVGDVALLRAEGHPIMATNQGYLIKKELPNKIKKYLVMDHPQDQTRKELEIFVKHHIIVESVIVEHSVYGEIAGSLNIKNQKDIDAFLKQEPELLSTLTQGIHTHKIFCPDLKSYEKVKAELAQEGLLYQSHE